MTSPLTLNLQNIEDPEIRTAFDQVRLWTESLPSVVEDTNVPVISVPLAVPNIVDYRMGDLTFRTVINQSIGVGPTTVTHRAPGPIMHLAGTFVYYSGASPTHGLRTIRPSSTEGASGGAVDSLRFDASTVGDYTKFEVFNERSDRSAAYNLFIVYLNRKG